MSSDSRSGVPPSRAEILLRLGFEDPEEVAREIDELLEAVFGPSDPEVRSAWDLVAKAGLRPKEMRELFRRAAEAEDPLQCVDRNSSARARLNAHMRVRWSSSKARAAGHPSSLAGLNWTSLSEAAGASVRAGLRHLADIQNALTQSGATRKDRTDTALEGLAGIYARQTGCPDHLLLKHAKRSNFVQFAVSMLRGRLPSTELEPGAISQRWKRLKRLREHGLPGPKAK